MSTSTSPDRPNRLVVGLGIATIVLFSANLLSMISQRVWPKLQDMAVFGETQQVDETAPAIERKIRVYRERNAPNAFTFHTTVYRKKRCSKRHDHANDQTTFDIQLDRSIESDMDRLEREIEREMERLNSDVSDARSNLENAVSLKLRIDGGKTIVLERDKLDLAELEEKIEGITKQFEVKVREYETAARNKVRQ